MREVTTSSEKECFLDGPYEEIVVVGSVRLGGTNANEIDDGGRKEEKFRQVTLDSCLPFFPTLACTCPSIVSRVVLIVMTLTMTGDCEELITCLKYWYKQYC